MTTKNVPVALSVISPVLPSNSNKSALSSVTSPVLAVTVNKSEGVITDAPARFNISLTVTVDVREKANKDEDEDALNTDVPARLKTELTTLFTARPRIVKVLAVVPEPAGPAGP